MPVAINDVIRVASEGALGEAAQANVNIFHFQVTTLVDGTDTVVTGELKTAVDAIWDNVLTILHTTWSMTNYSFFNEIQGILYDDLATSKSGTATDDPLPSQVAALVVGRTATPRVQGRKYLGGLTELQSDFGGQWVAAALTALNNWKDAYKAQVTGLSGNVYDPVTFNPGPPPPAPPAPIITPIIGGNVIQFARTQRSRTQVLGFA